jgi:serine/threonine protein kinase
MSRIPSELPRPSGRPGGVGASSSRPRRTQSDAAASPSLDLSGTRLGNYRLERVLGRGRMGVVYFAIDEALLRPTALKVLSWMIAEPSSQNPEAWFLAEARSMARINHPHVIQIYGAAKHSGYCHIAMELVDGAPAYNAVERSGPYPPDRATEILVHVASALHAAHNARVVHCDVKPENILIGSSRSAKLGDFGMARHAEMPPALRPLHAGTPLYTAPELWMGQSPTPATDIYALGVTYFYLLAGRQPFGGTNLDSLRRAHLEAPLPDVRSVAPHVPVGCTHILRRCLAKLPKDRYSSAQVLGWDALALLQK